MSAHDILRSEWQTPIPKALVLVPLAEMVARIEAIRLEHADPMCQACGSTVDDNALIPKWCPSCQTMKPRGMFSANRSRHDGRAAYCRDCRRRQEREWEKRRTLRTIRRAS